MNEILKLIEKREQYSYLILTKVYISVSGRTDERYHGNLLFDLKKLFGNDFELDKFNIATNFLFSEGYVTYPSSTQLTVSGRRYFEDFIKQYQYITDDEKELLKSSLPDNVVSFLGLSANVATIADFLLSIMKIK